MNTHKININPEITLELLGPQNSNLQVIQKLFSKLKIFSRGNLLSIEGSEPEIEQLAVFLKLLEEHINKVKLLTENDIKNIFHNRTPDYSESKNIIVYGSSGKIIRARTLGQEKLVNEFEKNDLIFATGPAGTGKTYMAIALAVRALKEKHVQKIIMSRPAVEAGEKLGFLPGDAKMKLDPYLQALYDAMHDLIPGTRLSNMVDKGIIQIAPLAYMRGRTLSNAVVILDEAQNTTPGQLKMFLTRMGENSKFIVTGDMTQIDLPGKQVSGLVKIHSMLRDIEGISFVNFSAKEIIRHPLVTPIVKAFNRDKS
ncbi:MAG: PhoH family protein [Bacteroidota bacterium]|nr:PhoH family protein [Bacteroidota bacterium]